MGKRIDLYMDLASLYSYFAFVYILGDLDTLKAHGVEVEFHPVFLLAVGAAKGNDKPPWAVPAKLEHGLHDWRRSADKAGVRIALPKDMKAAFNSTLAMRALTYIKANYSPDTFRTAFHYLFHRRWSPPPADLTVQASLAKVLAEAPSDFKGPAGSYGQSEPLFSEDEASKIAAAAGTQEMKTQLKQKVQEAGDRGAYGVPWLWVRNEAGKEEPFFGGDRFQFVYKFLGLPYQDVTLLSPKDNEHGRHAKI